MYSKKAVAAFEAAGRIAAELSERERLRRAGPHYVLTVTLAERDGGTGVDWNQQFEDPVAAARLRHIVEPANEQNLDRLGALLDVE